MESVLADTPEYLVEFSRSPIVMLTIARRSDGHCVHLTGRRVAAEFRDSVRTHGPDRAIRTFIAIARNNWSPLYKPARMPPHGASEVKA